MRPSLHIVGLSIGLAACQDWPLYSNLPNHKSDAIRASDDPADGWEVDWTSLRHETEPNDMPGTPIELSIGQGLTQDGALSGSGWDLGIEAEASSSCGAPLAFPPDSPGGYTEDVDWLAIQTEEASTLCASVKLGSSEVSFDLTMYSLDDCGEPVEIFVIDGAPVGIERTGGQWSGQVTVRAGEQVGIALGSYNPNDPDLEIAWTIALSLVPPTASEVLCPAGRP
jgi:hypothetical protein